jgi:hypothetical protein
MVSERMMVNIAWKIHVAATRTAVRKVGISLDGFADESVVGTGK